MCIPDVDGCVDVSTDVLCVSVVSSIEVCELCLDKDALVDAAVEVSASVSVVCRSAVVFAVLSVLSADVVLAAADDGDKVLVETSRGELDVVVSLDSVEEVSAIVPVTLTDTFGDDVHVFSAAVASTVVISE